MVRVVLVRPGTTDYDEQGRITGTLDIPLNKFGTDQVARATNELSDQGIEVVYCSPNQAAQETAQAVASGLGVKVKTLNRLENLDQGLWQGKLINEVKSTQRKVYKQWQERPATVCPPEGETLSGGQQRVQAALERLRKKHKTGVVALVVPEPLASLVQCQLSSKELSDVWNQGSACGSWAVFDLFPPVAAQPVQR